MNIIKIFFELATWIVIGIIAIMGVYVLTSNFPMSFGFRSYLVQSGSMEPTIMTGDIVVIQSQSEYRKHDVITFHDKENRVVTHRIANMEMKDGAQSITTKGDANRSDDFDTITPDQIIGKVTLTIPKLGFLVAYGKSLPGLIIMVMIPAALFIVDEMFKLHNA
jgi:signal peptidase